MFQMSGIGPMQGQANVFYCYLDDKIPVAISRYQNECRRLYEVLDKQLKDKEWFRRFLNRGYSNWCQVRVTTRGININGLDNLKGDD